MEAAQAVPITERLRNIKIGSYTVDHGSHSKHIAVNATCEEAAKEIERLQAENERLAGMLCEIVTENPGGSYIGDELLERICEAIATMTMVCLRCGNTRADAKRENIICAAYGKAYTSHVWAARTIRNAALGGKEE